MFENVRKSIVFGAAGLFVLFPAMPAWAAPGTQGAVFAHRVANHMCRWAWLQCNPPVYHGDRFTRHGGYYQGLDPWGYYYAGTAGQGTSGKPAGAPLHHSDRFTRQGGYYQGLDPWGYYYADPKAQRASGRPCDCRPGAAVHHSDRHTRQGGYYRGYDPWGFYFR